jgi:hypothetical protein
MTMRRLFVGMLVLTGLSVLSWVRADGSSNCCCEPICVAGPEECSGAGHDEALYRYRTNQSRHWRQVVIGSR